MLKEAGLVVAQPAGTRRICRVEREHRHLDRHGDGWPGERDAVGGEGGWPLYLQRYADLLTEEG